MEMNFRSFAILKVHFPETFRLYISVFNKVTAHLICWEFDCEIDGEFHNDVICYSTFNFLGV